MTRSAIVVVGSLNTDLVATVGRFPLAGETVVGRDFKLYCGGKGANQAYAGARLGGDVAMVGQVGSDDFGTVQITNLSAAGVRANFVQRDPNQPTGTAIIGVDSSGENRIIVVPGANDTFTPDKMVESAGLLGQAKVILLQLEIPIQTNSDAIRVGKSGGALIILDPAPAVPIPDDWFPSIDYLTPNLSELCSLTGERLDNQTPLDLIVRSARQLCAQGVRCVIAKLGHRGAVRITSNDFKHWPARAVQAIDTTAAGDCFNAAFAVELARGRSEDEAGLFAVAAASFSITRRGAQSSMPTRAEVNAFVEQTVTHETK